MWRLVPLLLLFWSGQPAMGFSCAPAYKYIAESWNAAYKAGWKGYRVVRRTGTRAWNSKGVRVFLKPPEVEAPDHSGFWAPYVAPTSHWRIVRGLHHLVDIHRWPVRLATYLKGGQAYDFTPLRGITHHTVKRPTRWISAGLGWKRDPTLAVTLPLELVLGAIPWIIYFNWADDEIKKKAVASVQEHGEEWEKLMQSDFRYQTFLNARHEGVLTDEKAKVAVAIMNQMNAEYFKKRSEEASADPEEQKEYYLGLPAFSDIDEVRETGFDRPGFVKLAKFEEIPSETTIQKLMDSRHDLMLTQERVHQWVHKPAEEQGEGFKKAISAIEQDPHVQELVALKRQGVISQNELSFRIQEDYFWRDRFAEWEILGVQKLKKSGGKFTDQPLTLKDIRTELRAEFGTLPKP